MDEKIYISLNGRVYIFDKDENININKFKLFHNNSFRIKGIFGSNDILFFSSEKGILNSLNNAMGRIKKIISSNISLRQMPKLTFKIDETFEYAKKINDILDKIKK